MALRDVVEYTKDGRGIRISGANAKGGTLRYRTITLNSPADNDKQIEFKPAKDIIEIKNYCVVELSNGEERLLIGPKKTEAKLMPSASAPNARFQLNRDAPPFHMSRLWLQNEATGTRFLLGNEKLNPKLIWRFNSGGDRFRFYMDEYCTAYYEGI